MPSRSPLYTLFDIRDNARFAQEWTVGYTAESFGSDRRIFYAVTRCLEIISEASRRLPAEMRDRQRVGRRRGAYPHHAPQGHKRPDAPFGRRPWQRSLPMRSHTSSLYP